MIPRPVRHRPSLGAAALLLGLSFAVPAPAARDDTLKATPKPPEAGTAASGGASGNPPKRERTESLGKPSGETRPNPEQANPALLNPCHGSPQPKWCGE